MKTYKISRTVTYLEHYEIEADSEQEAVEALESGLVDPESAEDQGDRNLDIDSIEEIEDEASTPTKVWNVHANDIGDFCACSGMPVYDDDDDDRCPQGCRASAIDDD